DHQQVLYAERVHHAAVAPDITARRFVQVHIAARDIAGDVFFSDIPQRGPRPYVAPTHVGTQHRPQLRLLHHRVVDRFRRARREGAGVEAQEIEIARRGAERLLGGMQDLRMESLQLLEEAAYRQDEHPAIPEKAPRGEVVARALQVGLLDEALDLPALPLAGQRVAELDVAIARVRLGRLDAEGDEEIARGDVRGGEHRFTERRG